MYTPPNKVQSPYLPFGDKQDAPFYFTDILSVKQFQRKEDRKSTRLNSIHRT